MLPNAEGNAVHAAIWADRNASVNCKSTQSDKAIHSEAVVSGRRRAGTRKVAAESGGVVAVSSQRPPSSGADGLLVLPPPLG